VVFADMHLSMLDVMTKAKAKYGADYAFAGGKGDGVHPGEAGHLVMAWVYLKALGYNGDIGTFTIDLAQNSATASKDHKIIACQNGKIEIESERYPFCFLPNPYNEKDFTGPRATMSVATLFPFNDDLNRMMLIVKGLKTPKAKVTWGSVSKEFDATQLEAGINLAAEFYDDNPFIPIFQKLSQAMSDLRNVRNLLARPKNKDDTSLIERKKKNEELIQPTPFHHTIEISALP
jgi:hypothetical protein